jgi:hypothetical protein
MIPTLSVGKKIVRKKYISFRRLTKRDGGGGGGGGGILIFRLQKFGEKCQFSFSYALGQNHSTYQQSFILTGFEALSGGSFNLLQYTNCKTLAIIVHS